MSVPNWTFREAEAVDLLASAKTLVSDRWGGFNGFSWLSLDLIQDWVSSHDYLDWAKKGLDTGGIAGWDIAVSYSKRAICRHIDSLIILYHLEIPARSKSYPEKLTLLEKIGVPPFDIVHDVIIDPRNTIEHQYELASASDARKAVQLATLVLGAKPDESTFHDPGGHPKRMLLTLNLNLEVVFRQQNDPRSLDSPYQDATFGEEAMLLVDYNPNDSRILILHPKDGEVSYRRLRDFTSAEAIEFAKIMKSQADIYCSGRSYILPPQLLGKFLSFLGLRLPAQC